MMMNSIAKPCRVSLIKTLTLASLTSLAISSYAGDRGQVGSLMSDEILLMDPLERTQNFGFTPFVLDNQSIRISANDISVNLLANDQLDHINVSPLKSDPLSFSLKDEQDGEWLVSLDLSRSAHTNGMNADISTSYEMPNQTSQFFISYGRQSLPVSVSFENPVNNILDDKHFNQNSVGLGFSQEVHEGWDVTISYLKSDVELMTTESALAQMQEKQDSSYRFYYDFNRDGSPEAINLMSNLAGIRGFQQNLEGIEIKISRQVSDDFALGASVEFAKGLYQESSLNLAERETPFEASALSLYGGMRLAEDWTLAANVNKQDAKFGLDNSSSNVVDFDETTLDIGLQYQTKWNKTGLVIRIDLMNLLGAAHLEDSPSQSMDLDARGLVPYTFQSPKYIKLSGSINF